MSTSLSRVLPIQNAGSPSQVPHRQGPIGYWPQLSTLTTGWAILGGFESNAPMASASELDHPSLRRVVLSKDFSSR